jgi:hypothetical protein
MGGRGTSRNLCHRWDYGSYRSKISITSLHKTQIELACICIVGRGKMKKYCNQGPVTIQTHPKPYLS